MYDVKACRGCRKLFNAFGAEELCPDCQKEMQAKYVEVKDYLWEHRVASMYEVSEACDVSIAQLKEWLREERLSLADGATDLKCEKCHKPILTGRYCPECKKALMEDLGSITKKEIKVVSMKKPARDKERMRFLDNSKE